jgi:hypothetical protein
MVFVQKPLCREGCPVSHRIAAVAGRRGHALLLAGKYLKEQRVEPVLFFDSCGKIFGYANGKSGGVGKRVRGFGNAERAAIKDRRDAQQYAFFPVFHRNFG